MEEWQHGAWIELTAPVIMCMKQAIMIEGKEKNSSTAMVADLKTTEEGESGPEKGKI